MKWALRKQKVPERLVSVVMALYVGTKVRMNAGVMEDFEKGVGVYQVYNSNERSDKGSKKLGT